jgi:hypothetical protein
MSVLRRSVAAASVALALAGTEASAQVVPHPKDWQWTIGGQGGLAFIQTPDGETSELPVAGIQTVIRARRTALMLSVQQAFGDDEFGGSYEFIDVGGSTGGTVPVTWDWARKYSAALLVFPIRSNIDPYFGAGVGILQLGSFDDDPVADELSAYGFGTLIGGLELSVGRFMAFGEYQLLTAPRIQTYEVRDNEGNLVFGASGRFIQGPSHSFTAGLRISIGGAREEVGGGDGI